MLPRRFLSCLGLLSLAACSAGGTSSNVLPNAHPAAASHGTSRAISDDKVISASPGSLAFTAVGAAAAQTITVSDVHGDHAAAVSSDPTCATVAEPAESGNDHVENSTKVDTFVVTPVGGGSCTITITAKKSSVDVPVTVTLGHLYVTLGVGAEHVVEIFDRQADGNVAPQSVIGVPGAQAMTTALLSNPVNMTTAPDGTLFVANSGAGDNILAYAPSAGGDVAPVVNLGGPDTVLSSPRTVELDRSGNIYVVVEGRSLPPSAYPGGVLRFAAGANGDQAPAAAFPIDATTQIFTPVDLAVAPDGTMYVASAFAGFTADPYGAGTILVFPPNAPSDSAPSRIISGPSTHIGFPRGVKLDAAGRIYVLTSDSNDGGTANFSVEVYPPGANGDVAPVAAIAGPATHLKGGIDMAVDAQGGVYVTEITDNAVLYFAPGANGNAAPTRTISGSNTGFASANGIGGIGL